MSWDMLLFVAITIIGFGFSLQNLVRVEKYPSIKMTGVSPDAGVDVPVANPISYVLDLGCLDQKKEPERITCQEGAVKVKGKFCHLNAKRMKGFEGMKVKNLTTGYEGTIFFRGSEAAFISDELLLQAGKNLIQLEWRESTMSEPQAYIAEIFEK